MSRYFGAHTLEGEWHSLLPRYLLLAERLKGRRILDIGCGSGLGASLLASLGAERVDAIDHRPAVLEIARLKHAKQGLDFHVMFWEELDFPDDTFDVVLCLDPGSPVTDPNLLLEMRRVLKEGGEYICAIERKNMSGLEKILPRYGYAEAAETVDITSQGERVPQLGVLANFFETVVPVVQRPHYSFVFDHGYEGDNPPAVPVRKVTRGDDSGLWVGEVPGQTRNESEEGHSGRWLSLDASFARQEAREAAVELLFCGDSHMPPPPIKEVQMPYYGLVERLELLFSDLHSRQNPGYEEEGFGELEQTGEKKNPFTEREPTSEFPSLQRSGSSRQVHDFDRSETSTFQVPILREEVGSGQLQQIQKQLDQMTMLYHQVRGDMAQLFERTQDELSNRDRYIEHLVHTVHEWQSHYYREQGAPESSHYGPRDNGDVDTTRVFRKPAIQASEGEEASTDELDEAPPIEEQETTTDAPSTGDADSSAELAAPSEELLGEDT